jgi:hypothetical protein
MGNGMLVEIPQQLIVVVFQSDVLIFYIFNWQIKLNHPTFSQFYEYKERSNQSLLDFGL